MMMWVIALLSIIAHFLGFIVYNEETILLGCFLLFVIFAWRGASALVVEELEDRGIQLQRLHDAARTQRMDALRELIEHHKTRQTLSKEISDIWHDQKELLSQVLELRQRALQVNLSNQIKQKFVSLADKERKLLEELQKEISKRLASGIAEKFGQGHKATSSTGDQTNEMLAMHIITNSNALRAYQEGVQLVEALASQAHGQRS